MSADPHDRSSSVQLKKFESKVSRQEAHSRTSPRVPLARRCGLCGERAASLGPPAALGRSGLLLAQVGGPLGPRLLAGQRGRGQATFAQRLSRCLPARARVARRRVQTRINGGAGPESSPHPPACGRRGRGPNPRDFPRGGSGLPLPSNAPPSPPPRGQLRAPAPSMAWQAWPAPCLWVASCGLLLLALVLLLSPRSCRARRTLRGLFMARSKRLLFRLGLVQGSGGMRSSGKRRRWGRGLTAAGAEGLGSVRGKGWGVRVERGAIGEAG